MAGMVFSAKANFSELEQLKQKIIDIKKELAGMDVKSNGKGASALMKELQSLQEEYRKQSEAAQIAMKQLEQLKQKYDAQGGTIAQLEKHIQSLNSQLRDGARGVNSPEYEALEKRLREVERAYDALIGKQRQTVSDIQAGAQRIAGSAALFDKIPQKLKAMFAGGDINSSAFVEQIRIQKEVLKSLEVELMEVKKKMQEANKTPLINDTAKQKAEQARKAFVDTRNELEEQKKVIRELEATYNKLFGDAQQKTESFLAVQRKLREEMMSLRNADGTVSPENMARYEELKRKLQEVGTAYRLVRTEQKMLTTAGSQIGGIVSGMSGIAGAFTAAQGAMSLFASKNEDLMKIQMKLQSAMSITMGLQAVANTLHQTSAFRIATVVKVQELWNKAIATLNTRLGISIGLSQKFAATGIGLLVAAILGAIAAYKNWNKEQKQASAVRMEVAKSTQDEITKVKALESVLKNTNNSYNVRNEALLKLKEIMPSYNAELDREGHLIADNTEAMKKYVEQLKNSATAKIYTEKLAKVQVKYDDFLESLNKRQREIIEARLNGDFSDNFGGSESMRIYYEKALNYLEEIEKLKSKVETSTASSLQTELPEYGTKSYWEKQQKDAQILLATMKDIDKGSKEWNEIAQRHKEAAKKLENWDIDGSKGDSAEEKAKQLAQKRLDATLKEAEKQRKIKNETTHFSLEMQQKQLDIEDDSFQKRMKQNDLNYEKEKQSIKEKEEGLLKELQDAERAKWESDGKTGLFEPTIKFLPEEIKGQIDAMYDVAEKAHENGRKKIIKEESDLWSEENTRFDSSLKKQLKEIDVYYDERIKLAKGNEQLIKKLEENRERERLQAITQNYIKEESTRLDSEQKMAESLLEARKNEYASESLYDLKKLQLLRDYARKRLAILKTSKAIEGSEDAKRNKEEIDNINQLILSLDNEGKDAVHGFVDETISGVTEIADAIGQISEEAGEAAEEVKMLGGFISQLAQGNYIGAAVTAVAGAITSNIKDHEKAIVDAKERESAYFDAVNWKIEHQIELIKELNGLTAQNMEDMINLTETIIEDKEKVLLEKLRTFDWKTNNSYFDLIDKGFGNFRNYMDASDYEKNLFSQIFRGGKMQGGNTTYSDLFEHLSKEDILALRGIESIWQILPEEVRNYINQLAEAEDQLKDLERTYKEAVTGMSFDTLKNSLDDLLTDADLTFEEIGKSFEDNMRKAILNIIKKKGLMTELEAWYDHFAEAMKDGELSEAETEELRREYEDVIRRSNDAYREAVRLAGIDVTDDADSENTLKGAYAKASQESIDLLAGQTGALRKTVEEIRAILDQKYTLPDGFIESIMGGMNAIPELIASGLHELIAIRELNARIAVSNEATAANTQKIGEISQRIEVIGNSVDGKLNALSDIADHTSSIGSVASGMSAAAGSLHNMERNVNVKFKGL
jgi:DNA repair exonuclease SbcCD ATPase subunit